MNTNRRNIQGCGFVLALILFLSSVTVAESTDQNPATLSKKEVKALLASGNSAADQQRLAAYYRTRAHSLSVKAQEFSAQADTLAKQPATIESTQGISCACTSHFRYFSKIYAQQAQEAEMLAEKYEQAAGEPVKK